MRIEYAMRDNTNIPFDNLRAGDVFTIPDDIHDGDTADNIYVKIADPVNVMDEQLNAFCISTNELFAIDLEETVVIRQTKLVVED